MRKFRYSLFDQEFLLAIQQAKMNAEAQRKEHNLNSFKGK